MNALVAENLTYYYPKQSCPVLEDVSLTLEKGSITALVGPNGAGKSSLLKLLQGQSEPNTGQITIDGNPLSKSRDEIALMPQRSSINWDFPITVEGLVSLGLINETQRSTCCGIEASLQRVGISEIANKRLDSLSGGQQQRALLAKTLMRQASIFLLDEPCSSLDPPTREQFLVIIRQLANAGLTFFVSSHDWGTSLNTYDKVVALDQTVLASGSPKEVKEKLNSINCMGNYCCA